MYNNPLYYNNFYPYQNLNPFKRSLNILKNKSINWSNLLNNTQKTLNVINQAIPVYYQIKPIWGNAKTMFRMANAIRNDHQEKTIKPETTKKNTNQQGPVFFL